MTRSELTAIIAARFPNLTRPDVDIAVAEILGGIAGAMRAGRRVEIRGFGSFAVSYRAPRQARNPKTGEPVAVPAHGVPHFKAAIQLRQVVDRST